MGYFMRVISLENVEVSLDTIKACLEEKGLHVNITIEQGDPQSWTEFTVTDSEKEQPICVVEKNPVEPDSLGREEIEELIDEVRESKPVSAAKWLEQFLSQAQVIYAIQVLGGAYEGNGWDAITTIKQVLRNRATSILQADYEGFSNVEGYHILWQFDDDVTGDWIRIKMDLANKRQRRAFCQGKVPEGVELV